MTRVLMLIVGLLLFLPSLARFTHAGTTTLEFDDVAVATNDPLPAGYGSNASSSTSGIIVNGGGTPDIALDWFALDDGWRHQTSNQWGALDPAQVHVAQMDWFDIMVISFITSNDAVFELDELQLGNSTAQIESDFGWDIVLSRVDGGAPEVVATRNSADLGAGETTTVVFDYEGEAGFDYELEFFPNDNAVGQFALRTALDGLTFSQAGSDSPSGDFNADSEWDCLDIDALVAAIAANSGDLSFDMNGDGSLTAADITDTELGWLAVGGANNSVATGGNAFLVGDFNLDGSVNGGDFLVWNDHKFTDVAEWCSGDANADGSVNGGDFLAWNDHKFTSSDVTAVPEPTAAMLLILSSCLAAASLRKRSSVT